MWLLRPAAPAFIQQCAGIFAKTFGYTRNSDKEDDQEPEGFTVPSSDTLAELVGSHVQCSRRISHKGVFFTIKTTHTGNSLILFHQAGFSQPQPAQIEHIFIHGGTIHLAVRTQLPLPVGTRDPFLDFPDFPVRTYSGQYSKSLYVIPLSSVSSHYARWTLSSYFSFVLDLSQVRILF